MKKYHFVRDPLTLMETEIWRMYSKALIQSPSMVPIGSEAKGLYLHLESSPSLADKGFYSRVLGSDVEYG